MDCNPEHQAARQDHGVQSEKVGEREVAELRSALQQLPHPVAGERDGAHDPESNLARPIGLFIPGQEVAGKGHAERDRQQPDENLNEVRQKKNIDSSRMPLCVRQAGLIYRRDEIGPTNTRQ